MFTQFLPGRGSEVAYDIKTFPLLLHFQKTEL